MRYILAFLLAATLLAAAPRAAAQADQICFAATNQCISGRIRQFWQQNGGLPVFGYPITPQRAETVVSGTFQAQWFERARLELHPENSPPYDVLLGRLGADRLAQEGRSWFAFPAGQPQAGCQFFAATGHSLCEPFLSYWRARGLTVLGLPLSEPAAEPNGGGTFLTQWFERARLEYHPENPPAFQVLGGLLGSEILAAIEAPDRPTTAPMPAPVCTQTPDMDRAISTRTIGMSAGKFTYRDTIGDLSAGAGQSYLTMEVTLIFYQADTNPGLDRVYADPTTFRLLGRDGRTYLVDPRATAALPRPFGKGMLSPGSPLRSGQIAFRLPRSVAPASLDYDAKAIAPQYPRVRIELKWPQCGA